jgi:TonB family protein
MRKLITEIIASARSIDNSLIGKNFFGRNESVRFSLAPIAILAAIIFSAITAFAAHPPEPPEYARQYAIYYPYPKYPYVARAERWEGNGLYLLNFDRQTGKVIKVDVLQTTGHKVLDETAIKTFAKWRFKAPLPFRGVRIPVRFSLTRRVPFGLEKIRANALYSPIPPYPLDALRANIGGSGRFEVVVDFETGQVQDVKILQTTGDGRLDRSVISTFRKWRFRPRTVHSFKTPFIFY